MYQQIRTDLAMEARELWREGAGKAEALPGVKSDEREQDGFHLTTVEITDEQGEQALGKPRGKYVTLSLDSLLRREENAFAAACRLLAGELRSILDLEENSSLLVAGLGNRAITPDAIGPETVDSVMVTRHLRKQLPEYFGSFRSVSAVCSGVLGTTGIESGELVSAVCRRLRPDAVIAVDALASRKPDRLCRTVQISDTGIVPGSGVGNAREALCRDTLGVPVIALGVPTVVDAGTLAADLASAAGAELDPEQFGEAGRMIVTPRDIDRNVSDIAKLLGYSINLALHDGLTLEDVDMFLS